MVENGPVRRSFTRALIMTSLVFVAGTGGSGFSEKSSNGKFFTSTEGGQATQTPTASPIIIDYGKAVRDDLAQQLEGFVGPEDLSGKGYPACVVDSDCLAGVQTCEAGTKPNTPQAPGYCVPIDGNQ